MAWRRRWPWTPGLATLAMLPMRCSISRGRPDAARDAPAATCRDGALAWRSARRPRPPDRYSVVRAAGPARPARTWPSRRRQRTAFERVTPWGRHVLHDQREARPMSRCAATHWPREPGGHTAQPHAPTEFTRPTGRQRLRGPPAAASPTRPPTAAHGRAGRQPTYPACASDNACARPPTAWPARWPRGIVDVDDGTRGGEFRPPAGHATRLQWRCSAATPPRPWRNPAAWPAGAPAFEEARAAWSSRPTAARADEGCCTALLAPRGGFVDAAAAALGIACSSGRRGDAASRPAEEPDDLAYACAEPAPGGPLFDPSR